MASLAKNNIIIISISHPAPCLCPRPRVSSLFPLSQAYERHYPQSSLWTPLQVLALPKLLQPPSNSEWHRTHSEGGGFIHRGEMAQTVNRCDPRPKHSYQKTKRHPSVESCGEAPRSVEQENPHYVGRVCFIDRLPGLSTIPDRPDITTMQEESACSMIAP